MGLRLFPDGGPARRPHRLPAALQQRRGPADPQPALSHIPGPEVLSGQRIIIYGTGSNFLKQIIGLFNSCTVLY